MSVIHTFCNDGSVSVRHTFGIDGSVSVRHTFYIDGSVSVRHTFYIDGSVSVRYTFCIDGSVSVRHTFCIDGSVSVRYTFCIDGSVSVRYTFCIDGSVSVRHTFCIDGSVSVRYTFCIDGISLTYLERKKCYGPDKKILFKIHLFDLEVKCQGSTKVNTVHNTPPYGHAHTHQISLTYLERQKCYGPDKKILFKNQRLPGACNRSPGSKLLSITTQLHYGGHLGGRA